MFSSNITLKATLAAEKERERADNRLAARYLKIRALLDEAERAINAANIARSLKNQLMSKLTKARRALDKGLNMDEVIDMMTLIVTIINNQIKLDKKAVDLTTSEMRKDLDTFYKYDFDKFLRAEASSRQSQDRLSATECRRSRSRETTQPMKWRRNPSEGTRLTREVEKSPSPTVTPRSVGSRSGSRGERYNTAETEKNLEAVTEEETKDFDDSEDDAAVEVTSRRDETGNGIDSLDEDGEELEADPVKRHTLETLVTSLNILQAIPKLKLNKNQQNYMGPTIRATKPFLQTAKGCAALAGPLKMLKAAVDAKTDGRPKEPLFTQALVEMNIVLSSFDDTERKLAELKSSLK